MKTLIALMPFFTLTSSFASFEVICASGGGWAEGPRLAEAVEDARTALNRLLAQIPEAGSAGYRDGNPVEVSMKRVMKTEMTSQVVLRDRTQGRSYVYTGASLCTTVEIVAVGCERKFDENSRQEYAICPSGRRIKK